MRAVLLLTVLLAGCAAKPVYTPPLNLAKPNAETMRPPAPLPPVNPGDNLYAQNAQCRAEYGRLATKVVALQSWVTIVSANTSKR